MGRAIPPAVIVKGLGGTTETGAAGGKFVLVSRGGAFKGSTGVGGVAAETGAEPCSEAAREQTHRSLFTIPLGIVLFFVRALALIAGLNFAGTPGT
jgi:hypothetical protein